MAQPIFLGGMISFFSPESNITREKAYLYAGGLVVCCFFSVVIKNFTWLEGYITGMKMRIAVCSVIYRKVRNLLGSSLLCGDIHSFSFD